MDSLLLCLYHTAVFAVLQDGIVHKNPDKKLGKMRIDIFGKGQYNKSVGEK